MSGFLPLDNHSETDSWEHIIKDKHLKNEWISKLNNIPNVEVLSTCEGHGRDVITHIIFRVTDPNKDLEAIYDQLNSGQRELYGTKAIAIDTQVGICFCVAIYNWYRSNPDYNEAWTEWWESIIGHIDRAVNN